MERERLCVDELAKEFAVHRTTIYAWLRKGVIPKNLEHREISGRRFFLRSEISLYRQKAEEALHSAT